MITTMTSWFLLQAFLLLLGGLASAQNEQDKLTAALSRWQGFNSDAYYFESETTFESNPVSFVWSTMLDPILKVIFFWIL
jgi:hypothetical protein